MSKCFFEQHVAVGDLPKEIRTQVTNYIEKGDFPAAKQLRDEWEQQNNLSNDLEANSQLSPT
jgi:hypothetical protein